MFSSPAGALYVTGLALVACAAQGGPVAWVTSDHVRVGQADSPGTQSQAILWAARGEYEPFQVIVKSPAGGLTNVNVSVSDLQGPGGQLIPKSAYTLYREHYIYVSKGSEDRGGSNRPLGAGWYPDALIPFVNPDTGAALTGAQIQAVPFSLAAGQNQPIWLDLLVPRQAGPGLYSGSVTVTSDQGTTTLSVALNVWNFELPLRPTLQSALTLYKPLVGDVTTERELIRHKLMPATLNPGDERSLIDNYGLNTTGLWFFSNASVNNCSMSAAPSVADFQAQAALQQKDLSLYVYSADEISSCPNLFPTVQQWARNMHAAGVSNLVTTVPTPALEDDGSGTGRSAVDIWVVIAKHFVAYPSDVAAARAKGDRIWSYTAIIQDNYSPKWLVDFDPINYRIQPGFLSQSQGLTGLVYWAINYWGSDPWHNIQYTESGYDYPGEGVLVYPGSAVGLPGVVPSMRLKWLRKGVEDYEYMEILKKLGRAGDALQIAKSVAPDWANWTHDGNALENARQQLGQEIHSLSGNITPPPPPPPPPQPLPAPPNTTAPVRSNGQPSGTLPRGTKTVTIGVSTSKNAVCKFGATANTSFANERYTFSTTGGTQHSFVLTLPRKSDGKYQEYVRCQDSLGNTNLDDYVISFSVSNSSIGQ